jgi:hypothetical protein
MTANFQIYASVQSMGYGYEVKALVNGKDIGLKGGMSEAKRLFGTDDPMKENMPPEMRERLFVLQKGNNTLHVEYKKTGIESDKLTFEFFTGENPVLSSKIETGDANGAEDRTFSL